MKSMEKRPRRRTWLVVGIVVGVLVLLVAGGLIGWQMMMAHFQRQYYQEAYAPLELATASIGDYPTEHHLDDVPWFATEETYCQSNSLQMIAAWKGIEKPRSYFDFLMGFTYGAIEVPNGIGLLPFTDPETGFVIAAPYLGLVRRYYVTDDEALYLEALRYHLSQGYPVRVALDAAVLYDLGYQLPHSEVLVGYDETGFYYYETVCMAGFPCKPCHLPPGEQGLRVSSEKLVDAVLGQAQIFSYPWRYSFTVFDEGSVEDDLWPIWEHNGQLLISGAQYGPRQGADAIEELAAVIEKRGVEIDASEVSFGLQALDFTRRDNAAYLREAFAGQADIERAADLFDEAAGLYAGALAALEDGVADQSEADQMASALRKAAALEREIGETFLARGAVEH